MIEDLFLLYMALRPHPAPHTYTIEVTRGGMTFIGEIEL